MSGTTVMKPPNPKPKPSSAATLDADAMVLRAIGLMISGPRSNISGHERTGRRCSLQIRFRYFAGSTRTWRYAVTKARPADLPAAREIQFDLGLRAIRTLY